MVLLAGWAAIAIENARLYDRERRRRRASSSGPCAACEATTDIARAVGGETELERVLELIVKRGRALVHARVDDRSRSLEGDELVVGAAAGRVPARRCSARGCRWRARSSAACSGRGARAALATSARSCASRCASTSTPTAGSIVPLAVPRPRGRRARRVRPAVDGPRVQPRRRAAAGGVRRERRDGGRDRAGGRRARRCGAASRRPSASGSAGRASCTTRRCRTSARLRVALSAARAARRPRGAARRGRRRDRRLGDGIDELRALITDLRPAALDELGHEACARGAGRARARRARRPEIDLLVDLDDESGRDGRRATPRPSRRDLPARPGGADQRGQARAATARRRSPWPSTPAPVDVDVARRRRGVRPRQAATAASASSGCASASRWWTARSMCARCPERGPTCTPSSPSGVGTKRASPTPTDADRDTRCAGKTTARLRVPPDAWGPRRT